MCPECSEPVASFADFQVHVMADHPDKRVPKSGSVFTMADLPKLST